MHVGGRPSQEKLLSMAGRLLLAVRAVVLSVYVGVRECPGVDFLVETNCTRSVSPFCGLCWNSVHHVGAETQCGGFPVGGNVIDEFAICFAETMSRGAAVFMYNSEGGGTVAHGLRLIDKRRSGRIIRYLSYYRSS